MNRFTNFKSLLILFVFGVICALGGGLQDTRAQETAPTPSSKEIARLKQALGLEAVLKVLNAEGYTIADKNRDLVLAVRERGIAFVLTPENEQTLSKAGANKTLIEAIRKEAGKFRDVTLYYLNLGDTLRIQKNFDEAILNYTKAIEIDPLNRTAFNQRGKIYKTLGDNFKGEKKYEDANKNYEKCIEDSTKYIEIDPTARNGYNLRGGCYYAKWTNNNHEESLANSEKAIADYTKAVELDPKFIEAYQNRADAYRSAGKKELADADEKKIKDIRSAAIQP